MMQKITLKLEHLDNYFVNESFKTLRTNLQFCGSEYKVIDITSCDANEGKSTIALMLSKSLADSDKKVIFVDCDLRKSVVATQFSNARGLKGMSEYLSNLATKEEVICSTQFENLDIILSGPYCSNPVELVMKEKFSDLIKELKETYDYVIVDTPPLGLVIDSAVIAKECDGAVMIINIGKIRQRQAKATKIQLEKSGCKILGAVLNHTGKRGKGYYQKYYKRYYGKGYYTSNYMPQEDYS